VAVRLLPVLIALLLTASIAHAQNCSKDFDAFLAQFESSAEFQRRNTRFPVSSVRTDRAMGAEAKTVFHTINSPADAKYPDVVFPTPATQAAAPLRQRIKKGSGARFVQLIKPAGGSLTFTFEMSAGCWQLIKFEDVSPGGKP
jgi:hypothetical protein